MSYAADRAWSDQYIPRIRTIIGAHLVVAAPVENDIKQATDLMLFKARDMRVAARLRRPGYADQYPYEFTIRSHRDSGAETELSKMIDGFGDWMFYGHASAVPGRIERWWLIDLDVWRAALIRDRESVWPREMSNRDGTYFLPFDVRHFPPAMIVGQSKNNRERVAA